MQAQRSISDSLKMERLTGKSCFLLIHCIETNYIFWLKSVFLYSPQTLITDFVSAIKRLGFSQIASRAIVFGSTFPNLKYKLESAKMFFFHNFDIKGFDGCGVNARKRH